MHSNGNGTGEQLVGLVESVNERGVKISGEWHNISRWAEGVTLPARGETIVLTLDRSGFVRSISPSAGEGAHTAGARQAATTARELTITRLAVVKAAASFAAARPEATSADVLRVAAAWEAWVTRRPDPDLEGAP